MRVAPTIGIDAVQRRGRDDRHFTQAQRAPGQQGLLTRRVHLRQEPTVTSGHASFAHPRRPGGAPARPRGRREGRGPGRSPWPCTRGSASPAGAARCRRSCRTLCTWRSRAGFLPATGEAWRPAGRAETHTAPAPCRTRRPGQDAPGRTPPRHCSAHRRRQGRVRPALPTHCSCPGLAQKLLRRPRAQGEPRQAGRRRTEHGPVGEGEPVVPLSLPRPRPR